MLKPTKIKRFQEHYNMEFTAKDIAEALGGSVEGNEEITVSGVSEINAGKPQTLSFLANPKYEKYIYTTKASIVLVNADFAPTENVEATLIRVPNAYEAMASLLQMYEQAKPKKVGIEQPSFISETATIGENAYIGAFAYIGEGVTLGNNVQIYPNAYIGDKTTIADNTKIYAGVKIYSHTKIGENCIVHSGAVIGADGFGFAPKKDGTYEKIPQLGNVVLEDNVEIGANTCVDRAMMGTTTVKAGVKLDNLVQIAHNCSVGENTVIASQTGIAGSTSVGKNCMFGGQIGVAGHIEIGDRVMVQAQAGIAGNTKDDAQVAGSPAIPIKQYYKSYMHFKKLEDLNRKVVEMKKKLDELTAEK